MDIHEIFQKLSYILLFMLLVGLVFPLFLTLGIELWSNVFYQISEINEGRFYRYWGENE